MLIVVGLGNPGKQYADTYHNTGYKAVQKLISLYGLKLKKSGKGHVATTFKGGEQIVFALPDTFMNLSGECVRELLGKFKANIDDLVVLYDDIDLPVGVLRLRQSGSAGTHNGMRNIVQCLNSEKFKRIRIGIGKPPENIPLMNYVLMNVTGDNRDAIECGVETAAEAVKEYIEKRDFERVMREYN